MTNTEIITNTVKAAFTPAQLAQLNAAIYTPAQVEKYAAAGMESAEIAAAAFHTFQEWKRLGYSVKKGQHAALVCNLWKYTDKPGKAAREEAAKEGREPEETDGHFYMAKAFLFSRLQVEKK